MEQSGILKKSIEGGQWMFLNTIFQKILGLGTFFILARLLIPEDFGLFAIIALVPTFLNLITSPNFETTVLQKSGDVTPYLNAIWTLNLVRALIITFVIFLFAAPIAKFLHAEKAIDAIRLGGLLILAQYVENVAQLLFFKNIDLKKVFMRDAVSRTSYSISSILLAWWYSSFWALFLGNMIFFLSSSIMTYVLNQFRPRLSFNWKPLKDLLPYGKWIIGQGILGELYGYLESIILGRAVGPAPLGLYSRAKGLAYTPSGSFLSIINKVGFSAYSKIQDSCDKAKDGFFKSLDILLFVTIPFAFLILVGSRELILILLGENWIAMDMLFKILAFAALANTFGALIPNILNALGYPQIQLKIQIFATSISLLLLLLFTRLYGVNGAALAVLITESIMALVYLYYLKKIVLFGFQDIFKIIFVPLIASLTVLGLGIVAVNFFAISDNIAFVVLLGILACVYLGIVLEFGKIFNQGPYRTILLALQKN